VTRVDKALSLAAKQLAEAGVPNGARDARDIMATVINVNPEKITLFRDTQLHPEQETTFFDMIALRITRHPVSHLVGGRDFYDRWFKVTPAVLDPRPETETLVHTALGRPFSRLLDLGVGSGAILISLLAERAAAVGVGVDVSDAALDVAKENAVAHGVDTRATFTVSDWFASITGTFDLIVSNPPYIAAEEMAGLQQEVRLYEPRIALTDEADGLSAYRTIIANAPSYLDAGGWLMVEIGPTQAAAVCAMVDAAGLCDVTVIPDMDGRDRVVMSQKPQD